MIKLFLPIVLSGIITATVQARPIDPLALGKCISLHDPIRYTNVDLLNVNCFYTWRLPEEELPMQAKRIPMIWGIGQAEKVLNQPEILSGYDIILLFNECDASSGQCVATPQEAAEMTLRLQAAFPGRLWVSPAVHNWGQPGWLDAYLDACDGCQIDAIAIHYYSWQPCNTADFKSYLRSFRQYHKPLWLTEYGCLAADPAYRLNYYQEWYKASQGLGIVTIMPWTENVPSDWPVWWRWGNFVDDDNTLTELGEWYVNEN